MKGMPQQKQRVQQTTAPNNGNTVVCRKCKSIQVVANKRGYSFTNMFLWLAVMLGGAIVCFVLGNLFVKTTNFELTMFVTFTIVLLGLLALPVAIIAGFVGRNAIINGCMNCGHKWMPAKRKQPFRVITSSSYRIIR